MSDDAIRTEADAVDRARGWAEKLLARVHLGPGDNVETAMHRAEQTYGIPVATFWALRYRPPKLIGTAAFIRLQSVYEAVCEAQEARLKHELEITRLLPPTPARLALIVEAEAVLGPADGTAEVQAAPRRAATG
jgi:hypothetical protein